MLDCTVSDQYFDFIVCTNLSAQRTVIDEKGNAAIVKVVESQIELFQLNENRTPTRQELLAGNYVTEEQYAIYLAHRNE